MIRWKTGFPILLLPALFTLTGCPSKTLPPPPPAENPEEEAARFGEGAEYPDGAYGAEGPADGAGGGNRFGFSGDGSPVDEGNERDIREMTPAEREAVNTTAAPETPAPKPEPPKPSGPPKPSQMPFANKVPGDPLAVTLPGVNASLGQISVEKYDSSGNPTGEPLPRGTPVEIPDPNNPGQKIYFKVP